ncbi:MAG: hypothetical protein HQL13_04780 [Candidatus Omnitrophica bacterium]|nr:hypothetical protein [Candidatus Omnitrophota bacterium]
MDIFQTKLFIDSMVYDFETVRYLLEYGRIKETWPVMEKIFLKVESFQKNKDQIAFDGRALFSENFWQQDFQGQSVAAYCLKLRDLVEADSDHLQQEMEKMDYVSFIHHFRGLVYIELSRLKAKIKSPEEKKMDLAFVIASCIIMAMCLFVVFSFKSIVIR